MKCRKAVGNIFFCVGILLCLYPFISGMVHRQEQKSVISTYESHIMQDIKEMDRVFKKAKEYNRILNDTKGIVVESSLQEMNGLSDEEYNNQLNMTGSGVMGSLEIPKIDVNLPIYHGTEDSVLSKGVGHLQGSNLPVGEKNTRSILTGHRGLPNAKLFTRLDELKKGDLFFIRVCGKTLAYKVEKTEVIKPEEAEILSVVSGKDLVSLVTCTPYGINTHRLVVTGERVIYEQKMQDNIKKDLFSLEESVLIAVLVVLIAVYIVCQKRKERKNEI
ncbi:class C sortase [Faecalimonas canis]